MPQTSQMRQYLKKRAENERQTDPPDNLSVTMPIGDFCLKLPQSFCWRVNWFGSGVAEWRLFQTSAARRRAAHRVIQERGWLGLLAALLIASVLPMAITLIGLGMLQNVNILASLIIGYGLTIPLSFILMRQRMRRSLLREYGQTRLNPCWQCGQILTREELKGHKCDVSILQPLKRSA